MIPYPRRSWFLMMLYPQGSFSPGVKNRVLAVGVIATALWAAYRYNPAIALAAGPFEIAGAVIALLLAFHINTSYNRFWEGRTLWGTIVNASRNLLRIIDTHASVEPAAARHFASWLVVFAHTTRRALRAESEHPEIDRLLPPGELAALVEHTSPPLHAAQEISGHLAAFHRSGALDPQMTARAEAEVIALTGCLGGCERILTTPIPLGYLLLVQRCSVLYLSTLPLALVDTLGVLTPLVTMIVAYPVLMIEALGRELDDPFGHAPNNLPLSHICDTIERNLLGTSPLALIVSSTERPSYDD